MDGFVGVTEINWSVDTFSNDRKVSLFDPREHCIFIRVEQMHICIALVSKI